MSSPPSVRRPLRRLAGLAAALVLGAFAAQAERPVAVAEDGRVRVVAGAASVALPATPGLVVENLAGSAERWVAAGTTEAGAFAVFAGDAARATRLPAPPASRTASLLQEPLPVLDDTGALVGLAWLEGAGARSAAVRFARWSGTRWERPVTVSAPGPGSQIALAAAALADGTVLLAWSAFDGGDDEILWSAWDGSAWSRPARLAADNAVPDVTPALAAVDGGAVAAWARFDGTGYTVVAARYAEGRWSAPAAVAPSGTAFPSFEAGAAAPRLVVRAARPRGWLVVDLDAEARPQRSAFAADAAADAAATLGERPQVEDAGGAATLSWPGRDLPRVEAKWEPVRQKVAP